MMKRSLDTEIKDMIKDWPFHLSLISSSPFHEAAITGNVEKVRSLIQSGADINFKEPPYLVSPIFSAVMGKKIQIIEMMIEAGVDLNVEADDHMTPLGCAVLNGNTEYVKLLVNNGANIHTRVYDNYSVLHIAAAHSFVEIVKILIEKGIDVNVQTDDEDTALHLAIRAKNKEMVKILIDGGADLNARVPGTIEFDGGKIGKGSKITPLHLAMLLNLTDFVGLLIRAGADVNAKISSDYSGLHLAAELGNVQQVNLLLQAGCDVNATTNRGSTPLYLATYNGDVKIVEALLKVEGIEVNPKCKNGETPLAAAAGHGNLAIVKTLVAHGAPINSVSIGKISPLQAACVTGQYQVVEWLIKNGADVCNKATSGLTPMHFASRLEGSEKILAALIKKGANVNVVCKNGITPLHLAAYSNCVGCLKFLVKNGGNLKTRCYRGHTVLDYAARVEDDGIQTLEYLLTQTGVSWDCDLCSPLYHAVLRGRQDMVKLILKNGGIVNGCLAAKETPLHIAAEEGHTHIVKLLLKFKPAINMRNTENGCTPLFLAIKKEHNAIVKILLENNADANIPNNAGLYPIHVAVRSKNIDVVKDLLNKGSYYNIEIQGEKSTGYPLKLAHKTRNPKLITLLELIKKMFDAVIKNDTYQAKCCIQAGAVLNAKNVSGRTALHYAVNNKNLEVVTSLLSEGVDLTQTTNKGNIPLHLAVSVGDMGIIKILLSHSRKLSFIKYNRIVNATTKEGLTTPLHVAAEKSNFDAVKLLIKNGAIFNPKNKDGKTPLNISTDKEIIDYLKSVEILFEAVNKEDGSGEAANILVNQRSVMNARHVDGGWTLLYWAISKDQTALAKVLVNNGADYFLVTNKGTSPLHIAASKGNQEAAKILLNRVKSDCPDKLLDYINALTVNGSAAMHVATNLAVVRCLMQRGAVYNIQNGEDKTPLDLTKNDEIRKLLQLTDSLFETVKKGNSSVMNTLNSLEIEDFKAVSGARNIDGQTLPQIALTSGNVRLAGKLLEKLKKIG